MPTPKRSYTPVHDPRVLRAIAHPVRNRILEELSATGPARAADLAADLGIPANQASFHLRQLAKYGVVEEAPEAARDRRDRVWKVVAEDGYVVNLRELERDPETRAASAVWRRSFEGGLTTSSALPSARAWPGTGRCARSATPRCASPTRRPGRWPRSWTTWWPAGWIAPAAVTRGVAPTC